MKRLIILALAMMAAPANAAWIGGNRLYELCTSNNEYDKMSCGYYIVGVIDSPLYDESGTITPPGVLASQLKDVVVKYMKDNPHRRHYSGNLIVRLAIREAWPHLNSKPKP